MPGEDAPMTPGHFGGRLWRPTPPAPGEIAQLPPGKCVTFAAPRPAPLPIPNGGRKEHR